MVEGSESKGTASSAIPIPPAMTSVNMSNDAKTRYRAVQHALQESSVRILLPTWSESHREGSTDEPGDGAKRVARKTVGAEALRDIEAGEKHGNLPGGRRSDLPKRWGERPRMARGDGRYVGDRQFMDA